MRFFLNFGYFVVVNIQILPDAHGGQDGRTSLVIPTREVREIFIEKI